ncbi:hypothetical protein, partial [Acinetobacter baumannii]
RSLFFALFFVCLLVFSFLGLVALLCAVVLVFVSFVVVLCSVRVFFFCVVWLGFVCGFGWLWGVVVVGCGWWVVV